MLILLVLSPCPLIYISYMKGDSNFLVATDQKEYHCAKLPEKKK